VVTSFLLLFPPSPSTKLITLMSSSSSSYYLRGPLDLLCDFLVLNFLNFLLVVMTRRIVRSGSGRLNEVGTPVVTVSGETSRSWEEL
jgi:hypothetical protein